MCQCSLLCFPCLVVGTFSLFMKIGKALCQFCVNCKMGSVKREAFQCLYGAKGRCLSTNQVRPIPSVHRLRQVSDPFFYKKKKTEQKLRNCTRLGSSSPPICNSTSTTHHQLAFRRPSPNRRLSFIQVLMNFSIRKVISSLKLKIQTLI